jgi:hypothetical protein
MPNSNLEGYGSARYQDLVSRIESLSGIEELSLIAHSPDEEGVFAVMVTASCDESADRLTYSVSGLLGMLPEMVELERLWELKLIEHNLPEFHAAKCDYPRKPFEAYSRDQRDRFQREFYGLIAKRKVWPFCTTVQLSSYDSRREEIEKFRNGPAGNLTDPYFLAFQHVIEDMCKALDNEGLAPRNEPIAFVFDRQQEYEGRATVIHDSIQRSSLNYKHRVGSLTFDNRLKRLSLQAADSWAYESRKYVSEIIIDKRSTTPRWQFQVFLDTGRPRVRGFEDKGLDALVEYMHSQTT